MTHARYTSETNELVELPGMEKPVIPEVNSSLDWCDYYNRLTVYERHLASLRRIPCSDDCKGHWKDGQELCEGVDYEIKERKTWTYHPTYGYGCDECCNGDRCEDDCRRYRRPNCPHCGGSGWYKEKPIFAAPLTPKSEDDVWKEAISYYNINLMKLGIDEMIVQLKTKYSITRK